MEKELDQEVTGVSVDFATNSMSLENTLSLSAIHFHHP